jgi:hypothetical protein
LGIEAGDGIISFRFDIAAKHVSCLRIAAGFNSLEKRFIRAEIRKGDLILGEKKE